MKTLIVEDNADDRRILRYNLERHQCDVIEAGDGQEGLEFARIHRPDLIISDALMPKMDGFRLLRSVRTDENLKATPFIFYSAVYTGHKEAELAVSLGADAFIIKPKEPEELWDEIKNILNECELQPKAAPPPELIAEDDDYLRRYSMIVATRLEEKVAELEKAVAELRRTEEKLKVKTAALERSNKELEYFATVAAHDLKSPLVSIGGYAEMLNEKYGDRLDDKARTYISYILDGTGRMERLIRDLLMYARITSLGRPFESVMSGGALTQALSNLRATVEQSGAVVTFDELPAVMGDETQFVQLFQNLIGNAIKYRGAEPPRIHVSAKPVTQCEARGTECQVESETQTGYLFSIRDNGIGIDPKDTERIFQIFERLPSGGKHGGAGIGLAVCKKIVERHGGRIWIESEPGKGSTFYFTIP